jgi:hypothetical protein
MQAIVIHVLRKHGYKPTREDDPIDGKMVPPMMPLLASATVSHTTTVTHSQPRKKSGGHKPLKYIKATFSGKKLPVSNGQEVARWRMSLIPPQ